MRQIIFVISLIFFVSCTHKITVSNVSKKSNLEGYFFYALPRNTLELEIKIKKTVIKRDTAATWDSACIKYLADKYDVSPKDLKALTKKTN